MPYVLRRDRDGQFVAPGGRASSYTRLLQEAKLFQTIEAAEREKCGNEYVVHTDNVMQPLGWE